MDIPSISAEIPAGGNAFNAFKNIAGTQNALLEGKLKNQFYAPLTQSTIDYKNALTSKVPSEIAMNQANASRAPYENALNQVMMQAQAAKNPFIAAQEQSVIDQRNALTQAQMMKNPYIAKQLEAQIALENARAKMVGLGGNLGAGAKEQNYYQSLVAQDNPNLNQNQIYEAANVLASGGNKLSDGTPLNKLSPAARSSLDRITKYGTNTTGLNQINADAILEHLFSRGDQLMPNASKFASLSGQSGKTVEQLAASLGKDSPVYRDYLLFTQQIVPQAANQMLLTEGARANNTQKAMMLKVADPITWNTNPKLAMDMWNYLTHTFRSDISPTVAQSISEKRSDLARGNNEIPSSPSAMQSEAVIPEHITEENIQYTMQKRGMTRDQVIQQLKAKGLM